ncbi:DUF3047 domain-containing protein [Rubrimonas cliftonensis]|uniref:DUF3047 domain-containing protein n=1 Tax=Rubrimonas cliftonensis TaxID=89524 RepID=A0A1H4EUM8_9RHOB|nr:DUF3047 domain-containing protein [Rubrimonas cliftonensis]SEA88636.1 Protein of unknown function [Rubrimonas cliftonensis]
MRRLLLALAALLAAGPAGAQALDFAPAAIAGWAPHEFDGETRYSLGEIEGAPAVHSVCDDSASGLFLEQEIDLTRTPILEWRWRVAAAPAPGPSEKSKGGDDFPARVYAVREALLPWNTQAINYVWAAAEPEGATWPNPFASQAKMVVVRSGPPGGWVTERRNLREDFLRLHGEDVTSIDAIAIMSDCDNRGLSAEAWYGGLRFLPE